MARGPTTVSTVAVAAGSVTAALAVASSQGWLSGAAVELLLAIGVVAVAVCVGWLVLQAVLVVLLRLATSVVTPVPPFGLERILRLMELQALEREAAAGSGRERNAGG